MVTTGHAGDNPVGERDERRLRGELLARHRQCAVREAGLADEVDAARLVHDASRQGFGHPRRVEVGDAFAEAGAPRRGAAVVRHAGRQQRRRRGVGDARTTTEVVRDSALVDQHQGPVSVGVEGIDVVSHPSVEDLAYAGYGRVPGPHPGGVDHERNVQDARTGGDRSSNHGR